MQFLDLRLDPVDQCLWRRGNSGVEERISLTPKAFAVLHYMVQRPGRLVIHDELLEALWPQAYVQPEVLKHHVLEVRKALGDDPRNPRFIETMPRRGYRFIAPVRAGPEAIRTAEAETANGRLVGRDRASADLRDCLDKASRGQGQIVFVTGEPGIGKTALVEDFQRRAAAEVADLRFARGQCVEGYGGQEPYYAMLEALGQLCRGPGGDEIVNVLAARAPTWLVQFPALLKREHRETLQREIQGATRERMPRELSDAVETIASRRPLLIMLEDLQWVDHATVDLLSALARRRSSARMMLVGSYSPVDLALVDHPLKALKRDLVVRQLCREIPLEPLSEGDVADFLAAGNEGAGQPRSLANLIHRHSGGNPLFMVATLDHMRSRGFVSRVGGVWRLGVPLDGLLLGVPESLRRLIEAQIERLSAEEQTALEVASVTGTAFSAGISAAAANLDTDDFENLCDRLSRQRQIVRPAGSQKFPDGSTCTRYEFVHALYREILYGRQSSGRKARLHAQIGKSLESLYSGSLGEIASELAHHFKEGFDWPRAVAYLQLAAETAGRRCAHLEATGILRHALELTRKLPDAARAANEIDILEKLAAIYSASYDLSALETYEALLARLAPHGLDDKHLRALGDMAYFVSWISTQRCLEVAERAMRLGSGQADPGLRARARMMYFFWHIVAEGWNPQYAEECRSALAQIRGLGDRSLLAGGKVDYSVIQWVSSAYREADRAASEAREMLSEEREEDAYLIRAYWTSRVVSSMSLLFLGEWGRALEECEATMAMLARNADEHRAHKSQLYRALILLHAQDHAGVVEICDSVLPLVTGDLGKIYPLRLCLALSGTGDAALGHHDRAIERLSAAKEEMNRQAVAFDWYWRMQLEWSFAEVWLAKKDLSLARLQAQRFLDVTLPTGERSWQALAWETSARVALLESGEKRAAEYIAKALSAIQDVEAPVAAWRVHATAAQIYVREGRADLAEHHRDSSRTTVLKLANSLPQESSLRKSFLTSPIVAPIVG